MGSMANTAPKVVTFHIPRMSDELLLRNLAEKYRALRLTGLKLSPEAFSSTLEVEEQHPPEVWISRLTNPQLETFICAVIPSDYHSQGNVDITDSKVEWIAQATLRGPLKVADFTLPPESGHISIDPSLALGQERWQFLALYTLPQFRGQGLAKKLCQAILDWLRTDRLQTQPSLQAVNVRTMIKRYNTASLGLFRKLGFVDSGYCTLAEALLANGESIPSEWAVNDDRRVLRSGCILNLVIDENNQSSQGQSVPENA